MGKQKAVKGHYRKAKKGSKKKRVMVRGHRRIKRTNYKTKKKR